MNKVGPGSAGGLWRSVEHNVLEAPPDELCDSQVVLSLTSAARLEASDFDVVAPDKGTSWTNTPEGEWATAVSISGGEALRGSLRLSNWGSCSLESVSVYRPAESNLALRLNFGSCMAEGAPQEQSVAVEVWLRRSDQDGESGLLKWMCALMPAGSCAEFVGTSLHDDPSPVGTAAPAAKPNRSGASNPTGNLVKIGPGRCQSRGAPPVAHPDRPDLLLCAEACEAASKQGDDTCTGFSFSPLKEPACLVHVNFPVHTLGVDAQASQDIVEWTCYAVPQELDTVKAAKAAGTRKNATLSLERELGSVGMQAMRWQVAPLRPDCCPPLQWIALGDRLETSLALEAATWDFLASKLPVVNKSAVEVDVTLTPDRVCVEAAFDPSSGMCSKDSVDVPKPPKSAEFHWWVYLVTMLLSAALAAGATWWIMRSIILPSAEEPQATPEPEEQIGPTEVFTKNKTQQRDLKVAPGEPAPQGAASSASPGAASPAGPSGQQAAGSSGEPSGQQP